MGDETAPEEGTQRMEDLVRHLVGPVIANADDLEITATEGDAVVKLELSVHDDDVDRVRGDKGRTLRAIRTVLSAAAGKRKASVDLARDADDDDDGDDDDDE